ncbi:MAG TPA: serine/threonine-protein kinase [Burkholderiaceae bacterium]|jgi:serine/threonine-protein kinase
MTTYLPSQSLPDIGSIPKGRIGRFIVEREIGKGSVGTVYQFRDPLIGRKVAIKILHPQLPPDQRKLFEKHFIQEARAAGRLNHPNIVTVYDADTSDDFLFIAMEYLEGSELREIISNGHQYSYKQIADMIARVANALDYAHQNGVIHRDIKPANIFIIGKNTPKVLDFGIASASRQLTDPEATLGMATVSERCVLGTPSYMSPEQTRAEVVDARTDIFSLGVVLYQLLCGELPFKGDTIQDLLENIEYESPVPPHDIRPDVPIRLAYIAGKALSKKPSDRYATAADMAKDLNRYIAKEHTNQIIATLRNPDKTNTSGDDNGSNQKSTEIARKKDPNRLPVFASVIVLAIFIVGSSAALFLHKAEPKKIASQQAIQVESKTEAAKNIGQPIAAIPKSAEQPSANAASANEEHAEKKSIDKIAAVDNKTTAKTTTLEKKKSTAVNAGKHSSAALGTVQLAVTPWGEVFVDGTSKGVTPPLSHLSLPIGAHNVEIRNGDDRYAVNIQVTSANETKIAHHF